MPVDLILIGIAAFFCGAGLGGIAGAVLGGWWADLRASCMDDWP